MGRRGRSPLLINSAIAPPYNSTIAPCTTSKHPTNEGVNICASSSARAIALLSDNMTVRSPHPRQCDRPSIPSRRSYALCEVMLCAIAPPDKSAIALQYQADAVMLCAKLCSVRSPFNYSRAIAPHQKARAPAHFAYGGEPKRPYYMRNPESTHSLKPLFCRCITAAWGKDTQ